MCVDLWPAFAVWFYSLPSMFSRMDRHNKNREEMNGLLWIEYEK